MNKFLAFSLMICTFIIGTGFGYFLTPEYQIQKDSHKDGLGKADENLDLRYINAMIAHHEGAIVLAKSALENSSRSEIQSLSAMIIEGEPKLINELYSWKSDWYNDKSLIDASSTPNLGTYDERFDLRFLNALIAHHEEGIEMAMEAKQKSTRNEILNNADEVESFLTESLTTLKNWRAEWYQI